MRPGLFITILIPYLTFVEAQQRRLILSQYGVGFQFTSNENGTFLTTVYSNTTSHSLSDYISGSNLWVSELFASYQADGYGAKLVLSQQLLNDEQDSRAFPPESVLRFASPVNVDMKLLTSFSYLCVKLRKHPRAVPDYQFRAGNNDYIQFCRPIPEEARRPTLHISWYRAGFQYASNERGIFLRAVFSNATSHAKSDYISGRNLWVSELFASRRPDGSGMKAIIAEQLLNSEQASRPLPPDGVLRFSSPVNVNLRSLDSFPYLCVKLRKHPQATPDYQFIAGNNNYVQRCRSIREGIRNLQALEEERGSHVYFANYEVDYRYEFQTLSTLPDPLAYITEVRVNADTFPTSDSVRADLQLTLFLAQRPDGFGTRRILAHQLLDQTQTPANIGPSQRLQVLSARRFNVASYGPGTAFPYICTEFSSVTGSDVQFHFGERSSAVGCGIIQRAPTRSQIEIAETNAQVTLLRPDLESNEAQANVVYSVTFGDDVPMIQGNNIWKLTMFASEGFRGTGRKMVISDQILDANEMSMEPRPRGQIHFAASQRFDVRSLGQQNGLRYLCLAFSTQPHAPVAVSYQGNDVVTTCEIIPPNILTQVDQVPRAEAHSYRMRARLSRPDGSNTNVDASIIYLVTFARTSDQIEGGSPLWRLSLFGGEREDGYGRRAVISSQLLDQDQMAMGVNPGEYLRFNGSGRYDFNTVGYGTDFPYLCVSLQKLPQADFELEFEGNDEVVSCELLPEMKPLTAPVDRPLRQVPVHQYNSRVFFSEPDPFSTRILSYIQYAIRFASFDGGDVDGPDLWQLRFYASPYANGTGSQLLISPQVLTPEQASETASPGGTIQFSSTQSFDAADLARRGYPYGCASFMADPSAGIEINSDESNMITTCRIIPPIASQETARAIPESYQARLEFNQTDPTSPLVYTQIEYSVIFDANSDAIAGDEPLWRIRLFGSERNDGTGRLREISPQLLTRDQTYTGVVPGGEMRFSLEEEFDSTGLGPGTNYPYICVSTQKYPGADFELVFSGRDVIIGCREFPQFRTIPDPFPVRKAIVSSNDPQFIVRQIDPRSQQFYVSVINSVVFDRSSAVVEGRPNIWRLRLFLSMNDDGSGRQVELSPQLLKRGQDSVGARPGAELYFTGTESYDYTGLALGPGQDYPYICMTLEKNAEEDNIELLFQGADTITDCEELPTLYQEPSRPTVVTIKSYRPDMTFTQVDPATPVAKADIVYAVTFDEDSDDIDGGSPLWQLKLFASEYSDGSGLQSDISSQILDREQMSMGIRRGEQVQFTSNDTSFNFTGMGPGTELPYVCVSLRMHPDANAELVFRNRNEVTGCEVFPLSWSPPPRALVEHVIARFDVEDVPSDPTATNVNVYYYLRLSDTADRVYGDPLWQMRLFASGREDGGGPAIPISTQILDETQRSQPVRPGNRIYFVAAERVNTENIGPGTDYPYICTTLVRHPDADFELIADETNAITRCELLETPTPKAPVEQYDGYMLISTDPSSTPDTTVNVQFIVWFSDSADNVNGDPLWQMRLFASQDENGTGPGMTVIDQMLDDDQTAQSVGPNGENTFTAVKSFDAENIRPGTEYPYVCTSLMKHPDASFEFINGEDDAITRCKLLEPPTPQAPVVQSNTRMVVSDDRSDTPRTTVNVKYIVRFSDLADNVDGNPLWQMRLFANQHENGTGSERPILEQVLNDEQMSESVSPGDEIRFAVTESFDPEDIGPGTNYPYVCTSLMRHPDANFVFTNGESSTITTCKLLEPPRAPVDQVNSRLEIIVDPSQTPSTTVDVEYVVRFSDSADIIDGEPLWKLRLFASQRENGTGPKMLIIDQMLDEEGMSQGVIPDSENTFTAVKSFDQENIGPDTGYPYVCTSLVQHPDADFELINGESNAITTCRLLESPLPQIPVEKVKTKLTMSDDTSDTPRTTINVEYVVRFSDAVDNVDDAPLWQLRLFASKHENGTGPEMLILPQILDEVEMTKSVTPDEDTTFEAVKSFDAENIGPDYPFVCTSFTQHPDAGFEITNGDTNDITSCEPILGESPLPQVPVEKVKTKLTISDDPSSTPRTTIDVEYVVRFSDSVDNVDDAPLWQLRLFASKHENGTGPEMLILPQMLDEDEMTKSVTPDGDTTFEAVKSFDSENIGPDYPFICTSLTQHPDAGFEIIDGDTNDITSCEPLFRAPELPESIMLEETKTCRVWGDPHQKTFDGYGFSFQKEGQYIAVTTCNDDSRALPQFQVIEDLFRRKISRPITYVRELILEYNGVTYSLAHPDITQVDGVTVTLPYSDDNGVRIHYSAPHQILTTDFGLVIHLDDGYSGDITLPVSFMGKVCGVCGNFDMRRGNECHYRDGTSMRRRNEECKYDFVDEWIHWRPKPALYPEHIKDLRPCGEGSLLTEAQQRCSILTDPEGPLSRCHQFASPDLYYDNCVFDLCQTLPSAFFMCSGVETYIAECMMVTGGNVTVGDWRLFATECELGCGEDMVFTSRGNPCPPTCANLDGTPPEECPQQFIESCQCAEGMVLDGTKCVPIEECGCKMADGRYLSIDEEFMNSDCTETCTCDAVEGLQCSPVTCTANAECAVKSGVRDCYCQDGYMGNGREECLLASKTCRIYGDPHFITFDEHFYSYQGNCLYTVARVCQPPPRGVPYFGIVVRNQKLIPDERYTYVTMVQLRQNGKTYRIPYAGRITVDGELIGDSLPYVDSEAGVEIERSGSTYVLKTSFGLEIAINGTSELTIKLPSVYFGKICGLCGNADGDDTNDKMLQSGELGKKLPFANSWSVGQCTPLDEPVQNCEEGTDEYAEAVDICSVIIQKDGPLAHCQDYQDPSHYFKSCVFDLCGTLPDTQLLCSSVNQYVQACGEKGGTTGDWKADVPLCVPVSCPKGYLPFRRSCYKFVQRKKSFRRSKQHCKAEGGHLVTVTSRAENDFVSEITRGARAWIGAERNQSASVKTFNSDGGDSYTFLPERIPKGVGSIRFGIAAKQNAFIVLSPTPEPMENTTLYEIAIGTKTNKNSLRLCMDCPEVVSETRPILKAGKERRFYINFYDGMVRVGRKNLRDVNLSFRVQDPIRVKYIGFKTVGETGSWTFYDNEFKWVNGERLSYDNFRFGEPSNYGENENCLETNYDNQIGSWNDHFCNNIKSFVCEIEEE